MSAHCILRRGHCDKHVHTVTLSFPPKLGVNVVRHSISFVLLFVLAPNIVAAPVADFTTGVKPILAKHCLACHGEAKSRGGLRLDRKADALKGGDNGKLFAAGKPRESAIWHRVTATDDTRMPPKGERLSATEIGILEAWIAGGAIWPDDGSTATNPNDWWSFQPIRKPTTVAGENPIDALIQAKRKAKSLAPSPPADRRTLIRRLHFDLVGLPPSQQEVDAFVADRSPDAYEKLVDRLLASPHYGERWARHWLDVVHFGETHGYDKDKPRTNAWPYRDYVIRALNSDKPYGRFVQEQIAGDVLFPGTVDGIEALGFLSAGPWDFIGHAELPESKIDGKIARHLDRDDFVANTMSTFIGLTVHCAQCHNHKFDPISHEDYYRLQAVFAAIDRTDRVYDIDPAIAAKRATLESRKADANSKAKLLRNQAGAELVAIEKQIADATTSAIGPKPPEHGYHSTLSTKQNETKWVQIDLGTSLKLERIVLRPCHDDFNNIGAGFGFPVRFRIELSDDAEFQKGLDILADETTKDYANSGLTAYAAMAGGKSGRYLRVIATKLTPRQDDFIFALAECEAFDASGKNVAAGKPVSARDSIEAPIRWRKSNLTDGIYPAAPKFIANDLAKRKQSRDEYLRKMLGDGGVKELAVHEAISREVDAKLLALSGSSRMAFIGAVHTGGGNFIGTGASGGKPRPIAILPRGDVTKPGKEVAPGVLPIPGVAALSLPANHTEGDRRAALAKWLSDANHPLTWRVMANRVWQYHFGRGLVDTPNDYGKMGQLPSHPELLDFLANELREHQSLKKLHKSIVASDTYRLSSESNPANETIDSENRYLWRQNRRKLEAEAIRDSILLAAGKLDRKMGGPSFQDFVVEKPEHSPHYLYHLHDPDDVRSHRRTIYRFVVRSQQQPFLASLDCADPSLSVDKRNQTLTPQQALALLNNNLSVAMAKHFATRVEALATDDAGRISAAFQLAIGREPSAQERDTLVKYVQKHGLANGCRVILNLNEFAFVD